jgi:hypothetical protein
MYEECDAPLVPRALWKRWWTFRRENMDETAVTCLVHYRSEVRTSYLRADEKSKVHETAVAVTHDMHIAIATGKLSLSKGTYQLAPENKNASVAARQIKALHSTCSFQLVVGAFKVLVGL